MMVVTRNRAGRGRVTSRRLAGMTLAAAAGLGMGPVAGVGALLAPGSGAGLSAQEAGRSREVRVLTLREALDLATEFNPRYRQALNRMELEGAEKRQAWAAFLPTLSVSYSTSMNLRREVYGVDDFGRPVQNPEATWLTSSNANQNISVGNVRLFDGGARYHDLNRVRAQTRSDRLGAQQDLTGILVQVQRSFLNAQRQKAQLQVETELLADRVRDLELIERRFALVLIGRADLLAGQLALEQQRTTLRAAEGQVETAMLALRVDIGDPDLVAVDVPRLLEELQDPSMFDVDDLVARALAESPTIGVAEAQMRVAEVSLSSQGAQRWPTITASSSWGGNSWSNGRESLFDLDPQRSGNATVALNFTIPIFDGFQRSTAKASARVTLLNSRESFRETEMQLERDIRTRFVELETAWANLRQRERALEIASERLQIVQLEYQLANVDIDTLRNAAREEATARRQVVDQGFALALALLSLYETAGIVDPEAGIDPGLERN